MDRYRRYLPLCGGRLLRHSDQCYLGQRELDNGRLNYVCCKARIKPPANCQGGVALSALICGSISANGAGMEGALGGAVALCRVGIVPSFATID